MKTIKMRAGMSLVEILVALCVLGLVVPPSLGALGGIGTIGLRIEGHADKASFAEWWFNRLKQPVSPTVVNAMPRTDASGRFRFSWESEIGDYGAVRITLRVFDGSFSDVPFVTSRVY